MSSFQDIEHPSASQVAQIMVFNTLWRQLPQKSFISGLWLRNYNNTPLWVNCFLNVLPVDKYRYFRHYFGNIILVTPGEKGLWEQASEENRISYALSIEQNSRGRSTANWKAVRELEQDLKLQYARSFPITKGIMVNHQYTLEEQKKILGKLNAQFWEDIKKPQ
jgi:hypothetical protein